MLSAMPLCLLSPFWCTRTAMPSIAAAEMRYLINVSTVHLPSTSRLCPAQRLLGGLRLFVFFFSSRCGSWLDIESVCCTGSACCDIVCDPRDSAGAMLVVERSRRSLTEAEEGGGPMFEVSQAANLTHHRPAAPSIPTYSGSSEINGRN